MKGMVRDGHNAEIPNLSPQLDQTVAWNHQNQKQTRTDLSVDVIGLHIREKKHEI